MKNLSWKHLVVIISLAGLAACGSSDDDDDDIENVVNEQLPQEERIKEFSTRLNNNLLIAGRRCEGSETTTDNTGATVTCEKDQWLITLDDVNTCTPGGACTEIGVIPFVAELDRSDRVEIPRYSYFEVDPLSRVTPNQEQKIDDYLVRFDLNEEEAEVVSK